MDFVAIGFLADEGGCLPFDDDKDEDVVVVAAVVVDDDDDDDDDEATAPLVLLDDGAFDFGWLADFTEVGGGRVGDDAGLGADTLAAV